MFVEDLGIKGLKLIAPDVYEDDRGWFTETYQSDRYSFLGESSFQQDNLSFSKKGVLRGLHYQLTNPQGKLVRVVSGAVWDVAVDIRVNSPTYGKSEGVLLTEANKKQFWIPPGFAHGFVALEDSLFEYKCTTLRDAESEGALKWDDPDLDIWWSLDISKSFTKENLIISNKDQNAISFKELTNQLGV